MIKANFTQNEKRILSRAAEIEIQYLLHIAQSKPEIHSIKELMKHPETMQPQIPDENLEIDITLVDMIKSFTDFKDNPESIYNLPVKQIDLISLILIEHFEDQWKTDDDMDEIEWAALCYKIVSITDLLENNPINPN
jgi:hypothetical protein